MNVCNSPNDKWRVLSHLRGKNIVTIAVWRSRDLNLVTVLLFSTVQYTNDYEINAACLDNLRL
jgi:hypothetical protein